jgi:SAM-dependent methyltransferase
MRTETAGFQKESHAYERGRPGYPDEAVEYIVERAAIGPGERLVDLAAGTGKLTRALVGRGVNLVAVEPLAEMRARLSEQLPEVAVLAGTADNTGLESASAVAVTIAQAFHWFANEESLAEIGRILKDRGKLFLVWNRRDVSDPVQAAISRLTAPYVNDTPSYGSGAWREVMAETMRFAPVGKARFRLLQRVDRNGIVDRVGSTSYIAMLNDAERLPLLEAVAELVPPGAHVDLPYETDVHVFERR